jgi:hypothetical protein
MQDRADPAWQVMRSAIDGHRPRAAMPPPRLDVSEIGAQCLLGAVPGGSALALQLRRIFPAWLNAGHVREEISDAFVAVDGRPIRTGDSRTLLAPSPASKGPAPSVPAFQRQCSLVREPTIASKPDRSQIAQVLRASRETGWCCRKNMHALCVLRVGGVAAALYSAASRLGARLAATLRTGFAAGASA